MITTQCLPNPWPHILPHTYPLTPFLFQVLNKLKQERAGTILYSALMAEAGTVPGPVFPLSPTAFSRSLDSGSSYPGIGHHNPPQLLFAASRDLAP